MDRRLERLLPVPRWPTAFEAAQLRLFEPLSVGRLSLPDRTWVPAMVPWRASEEGEVTDAVLDWYGRFAQGRPGCIVLEATGIRDVPSGPLLRIGHDRFVPGLKAVVERVREASGGRTRLFVQLIDFLRIRRRPPREKFLGRYLEVGRELKARLGMPDAPEAAVRARLLASSEAELEAVLTPRDLLAYRFGARETIRDMHLEHIRRLPEVLPGLFAAAARRAREAGFDGVELHYAHAYTMAAFLSRTNDRRDGYGGSLEGRLRLPIEVYQAVRRAVGEDFVVGVRFLGDEVIDGGSRIEDACAYAQRFAEVGFDFLSVSKGGKFEDAKQPRVGRAAYPYTGPSGRECMPTVGMDARGPFSRNVPLAAAVRRAVREAGYETPVVAAGGIATWQQAEAILARGEADIIASARQSLCDPDWFLKLRLGRGEEIRRCLFTNYCEGLDQAHKEVTCQRWDRLDLEGAPRCRDGRRRLVAPPWPGAPY
ncbi:MAG: NADH:flavin oxidoreductase [Deltaproteobacteria bacterium]|nr:MAG: NADH:flavin oxidoreductase [Deltaproteobacteria bacterium]